MAAAKEPKFEKGQQVQLVSGGPAMVVNTVYPVDLRRKLTHLWSEPLGLDQG